MDIGWGDSLVLGEKPLPILAKIYDVICFYIDIHLIHPAQIMLIHMYKI